MTIQNNTDRQYRGLIQHILTNGRFKGDRTGVGTKSVFGYQMRFDLSKDFPLITGKKVFTNPLIRELLWFLSGDTNNNTLHAAGVNIWNDWALTDNNLTNSLEEREKLLENNIEKKNHYVEMLEQFLSSKTEEEIANLDISIIKHTILNDLMIPNKKVGGLRVGDLGPIYSAAWRRAPCSDNVLVFIDIRKGPTLGPVKYPEGVVRDKLVSSYSGRMAIYRENNGSPFTIISGPEKPNGDNNTRYLIQFEKTNAVIEVKYGTLTNTPAIRDPYELALFNVACMGRATVFSSEKTYNLWRNMIVRCYDTKHPSYQHYGAKGVYVSPRWLCYENFAKDVSRLINYEQWCLDTFGFQLDKDYYGSNCYDVSTCVFLPRKYNIELSKVTRPMKSVSPDGEVRYFMTRLELVEYLGVSDETFRNFEQDIFKVSCLDGWNFEEVVVPEGKLFRRRLSVDQIAATINSLRKTPTSRRVVVSGWIPELLPDEGISPTDNVLLGKQALPPCHTMFQFYAEEMTYQERNLYVTNKVNQDGHPTQDAIDLGALINEWLTNNLDVESLSNEYHSLNGTPRYRLSCQLYQRSADVFIGVPYNIASYALLTMMIAQVTGMAFGDFIHTLGDAHIYTNHFEQVDVYMQRDVFDAPKVYLNPEIKEIDDFTFDDIKIIDYISGDFIKAPVAV